MTLTEFIERQRQDNIFQRILMPNAPTFSHFLNTEPSSELARNSSAAYAQVLGNLYDGFGLVLLLEREEESMVLLENVLGLVMHDKCLGDRNQSGRLLECEQLRETNPETAGQIESLHHFDLRIYSHVQQIFQQQIDSFPDWTARLALYRERRRSACGR